MEGGKWGLVIVASAFLIQVFTFGASTSIGVYNIEFLDYFDNDTVGVSFIAAINWATFLGSGPLASYLITKTSHRKIALLGSVMVVLGMLLMPFLPYIPALCISFGVLSGVGSCLVYVPSHVLSGVYYKRHQSLATGIATSGSGLGGAIMPIVFGKLIQIYGWKASLIVGAGLQLHLIVCAALLRSPPVDKACQTRKISDAKALLDRDKPVCEMESAAAVVEDARGLRVQKEITCQEKSAAPEDSKALLVGSASVTARNGALAVNDGCEKLLQVNALGFCPDGHEPVSIRESFSACALAKKTFHDHAKILTTQDANHIDPIKDFKQTKTGCLPNKVHTDGDKIKDTENGNPQAERADVFLTSDDDIRVLRHIYLFTDVGFDVYFVSSIMWNATASMMLSFGPEYTSECGISDIDSAWLLTILGLGDFVGGIIGGVIGNIWVRHRRGQYVVANVLFGLFIAAYPFGSTFGEFAALMLCAGLTFGVVLGLLVVVLIDLVGSHNLGDGLGYIMLSNGIGAFAGPGLAGHIRKVTGSFDLAFYIAGILAVAAGACMLLIPIIHHLFPNTATLRHRSRSLDVDS